MNNTKRTSIIICVIIATISLFIFLKLYSNDLKSNTAPKIELSELRNKIREELAQNNNESHTLDHICSLMNLTGICYFNASIRLLMADKDFVLYFIMNDFKENQIMSLTLQTIFYKCLTLNITSLITQIENIHAIPQMTKFAKTAGGGCVKTLLDLCFYELHYEHKKSEFFEEILNILYKKPKQTKKNFNITNESFIQESCSFNCSICGKHNNQVENYTILETKIDSTIQFSVDKTLNMKLNEFLDADHECRNCKYFGKQEDKDLTYTWPDRLFIQTNRLEIKHSKIYKRNEAMEISEKLTLNDVSYQLLGSVLFHDLGKILHVNTIVRNKNQWVLCNDEIITRNCNINDYKQHGYIFLYKKV
ncbi:hypothetical protein EDEG_02418 [Edhazardia aedis USNM 41457]|uniref:USP domain-containing protein n=1 Tax=Edhazardia aedis (strain USNM 41457) TaxID=1003232 RepID=J8ZU62_EDHAE|nr:hypothetical protein EDEG_02418 [Edhazardia aedis USNM 41457]|eukprot:EJW03203.1 hypothetical protein EDEG_02418 [Edhazardia aedis USNM 41457]